MDSTGKIGIFDSGVGGITVFKRIIENLPNEEIIYYGDTLFSPYGEKSKEEIEERCIKISSFLIEKNCKIIVIACNTATVAAIQKLKQTIKIPVIGIINPGAYAASKTTRNKKIGVIATPFTIKSLVYTTEIRELDCKIEVFGASCKLFCPMIEKGWNSFENRLELIEEYLAPLPKDIDTLVLGCTHYPIILEDIKKYFKGEIVDPAFEVVNEVKRKLKEKDLINNRESRKIESSVEFYVSGDREQFKKIIESILGYEVNKIYREVV
ncbi:MAG: glutamate racemase [Fusobacteriaceae bacterium]